MPSALILSPHLDDAAFSCGGLAARLAAQGWRVTLATLFTASIPQPRGFALHEQTSRGIPPNVDYMALRRREDVEAARHLGAARVVHLPLPEAPHRGYPNPDALRGSILPFDEIVQPLTDHLRRLGHEEGPDLVLLPQGIGGHVDHRLAIQAALQAGLSGVHAFWRDTPYVMQRGAGLAAAPEVPWGASGRAWDVAVEVTAFMRPRLQACAAYRSQLGYQFGGEQRMAEAVSGYARHEGQVAGLPGRAVEVVTCATKADAEFVQRAVMGSGGPDGGAGRAPYPQAPPPAGQPQPYAGQPSYDTAPHTRAPQPPRNYPQHGPPPSRPVRVTPSYQAPEPIRTTGGDGHAVSASVDGYVPLNRRLATGDGALRALPPAFSVATSGSAHQAAPAGLHESSQPRTPSLQARTPSVRTRRAPKRA
jgi:LmbE family N-acetylglucosaminyl deacetylase